MPTKLKLAIVAAGRTQREVVRATRIAETRLSAISTGSGTATRKERCVLARTLGIPERALFEESQVQRRQTLPEVGFVRLATILAIFPVARSTWWAGVKAGRYPRPTKLGPRVTAWNVSAIRSLLEQIDREGL